MFENKKEEEFLIKEAKTFRFGKELFGRDFYKYSYYFIVYPQNFEAIKVLAKSQNYKVSKKSVLKFDAKPFGVDEFLLLAPFIDFPSTLFEIVYGQNEQLNSFLENPTIKKKQFIPFARLKELADFINKNV